MTQYHEVNHSGLGSLSTALLTGMKMLAFAAIYAVDRWYDNERPQYVPPEEIGKRAKHLLDSINDEK